MPDSERHKLTTNVFSTLLTLFFIFTVLVAVVNGQQRDRVADPDPRNIATQTGANIKLLCRVAVPITSCGFRIPGEYSEQKFNEVWQRSDNYRYFGQGLESGECGIEILSVNENMNGVFTCRLDMNDGGTDALANITVTIAKPPQDPRIEIINAQEFYESGEEIEAVCTSIDGRPAATLAWFLDDKPLGPGQLEVTDSQNLESTFSTAQSTLHFRLKPEDNNGRLICRASHVGFADGVRDAVTQLIVRFKPVPLSEINISGLEIGSSAIIGPITIQANPTPRVSWLIDGKVMQQGEQNERFVVRDPIALEGNRWNASLQVVSLTLEDTTRSYTLRATNAIGTTDYKIRIGGSSEVAGKLK